MPEPAAAAEADAPDEERRNVARLVRVVALCVAWPSLSTALALLVFAEPSDHWLHVGVLLPLGLAACAAFALAPRLAARFVRG